MRGECLLNKIQIKNLRSLKDTDEQILKPITLLLGENSSGKSTFLRSFPLIKQSLLKRTSGPILWAGDVDDYVDFGSFKESITNGDIGEITFKFSFDYYFDHSDVLFDIFADDALYPNNKMYSCSYEISICTDGSQGHDYDKVSSIHITLNNTDYYCDFNKRFFIDGMQINLPESDPDARSSDSVFGFHGLSYQRAISIWGFRLPDISPLFAEFCRTVFAELNESDSMSIRDAQYNRFENMFMSSAVRVVGAGLCANEELTHIKARINRRKDEDRSSEIVQRYLNTLLTEGSKHRATPRREFENKLKLFFLYSCFDDIDTYLYNYFKNVHYIAPLRATAERYYRMRNLAVDEIDFQGKNLSVFINSLSEKRLAGFQDWTEQHFGFCVFAEPDGGHLSLKVRLKDSDKKYNLSDTGFGYSQILPIITQLWDLSTRKTNSERMMPTVIAIEQPELHLHPAMQSQLARAFIASIHLAAENNIQLQFILETHSETIVNYFGKAIARKSLAAEDTTVLLFEKDRQTNLSTVTHSSYDNNGFLQNWPIGFFAAGEC